MSDSIASVPKETRPIPAFLRKDYVEESPSEVTDNFVTGLKDFPEQMSNMLKRERIIIDGPGSYRAYRSAEVRGRRTWCQRFFEFLRSKAD